MTSHKDRYLDELRNSLAEQVPEDCGFICIIEDGDDMHVISNVASQSEIMQILAKYRKNVQQGS